MAQVLIIDDQPYVREFLSEELAHDGYRTKTIGDPDSIWGHLTNWHPDVVLLDLYLDGFKGWDILGDIKRIAPDLPVLIHTAYDTFEQDPRLSQAEGYVIKRCGDLDKLKEKIADVLERKTVNQRATYTKMME